MKVTYDQTADAMYIYFARNKKSTRTEVMGEGIVMDYEDDKLIGIEILDASKKLSKRELKPATANLQRIISFTS